MIRLRHGLALVLLVAGSAAAAEGRQYAIDPVGSDVHWLVYKAGSLARLGHNHVISVAGLTGSVSTGVDPSTSRFELQFPVASLVVDDANLRNALGPDFASVPSADDVAGTRKNMLSERVLMGDHYATIRVTGQGPSGADGAQTLQINVELLGRTVAVTVPTTVQIRGDELTASGEFELTHSALGMTPFSVMLGALQVADKMKFVYRIRATAAPPKN
jgi:hypothetical protein